MTFGKDYCRVCGHKNDLHTFHKTIGEIYVYVCDGESEFCGCTQGYGKHSNGKIPDYIIPDPKS